MSGPDSSGPAAALTQALAGLHAPGLPPMFGAQPKKPKSQPFTPTFLGAQTVPQAPQLGKATLLGAAS